MLKSVVSVVFFFLGVFTKSFEGFSIHIFTVLRLLFLNVIRQVGNVALNT